MQVFAPLVESLKSPAPIYLLAGSDPWLAREAVELVRKALLHGATQAFNDATFAAGEERGQGLLDVARMVPMMADRRLVTVRQLEEASVALMDALLGYAQAPVPSTVLLLLGEKLPSAVGGVDRGIRLQNAVKKVGYVAKFESSAVAPTEFVRLVSGGLGVKVAPEAIARLTEYNGGELSLLAADLEKCADYVGRGGTVTADVVDELCVSTVEADIWGLTDAIIVRDPDRALGTLHRLLEDGDAPHRILAMVAWQLRQVLALQDVVKRGLPEREANLRMPPQKARAIRESVTRRPVRPSLVLEELGAVNRAMNSSRAGDRRVLEAWVLRLVTL